MIEPITPQTPCIASHRGPLRPERALVYNDPTLLLHHAFGHRASDPITAAELAGAQKTATRILAITRHIPWALVTPLAWPTPEVLLFTTADDDALACDLAHSADLLEQAERLTLHSLDGNPYLRFRRC